MRLRIKRDFRTIFAAIVLYMIAFYAWNLSFPVESRLWEVGDDTFAALGSLAAAVWLTRCSRACEPSEKRFWRYVTYGASLYFIGDAIWFVQEALCDMEVPYPGSPDFFYLLSASFFVFAFILKIVPRDNRLSSTPLFDIAIIMTVAVSLSWEFIIKPIFLQTGGVRSAALVSLAYNASDLALLFGALCLYWVLDKVRDKKAMLYFIIGMILQIAADSVYYSPFATENEWIYAIIDPFYTFALLLIAYGGFVSRISEGKNEARRKTYDGALRLALPYATILILLAILLLQQNQLSAVMGGFAASIMLIVFRQLGSYRVKLKDASEELRSTRKYLESFVNHTSDAIHVMDLQGNVLQMNRAFETMYGWSAEETLGKPLMNVPGWLEREYEEILTTICRKESVTDYETIRNTKNGQLIDVSITISPIRDHKDAVVAIASISRNITARKQAEEALRQSEKLSVIGQLAAGVAHEIRNPLTTLKGFVQLQMNGVTVREDSLELMLSELDRINLIVSEFLVLSKPQAGHFQAADLKSILEDIGAFLQPQAILHNVTFNMAFAPEVPPVHGEINQLKQVFINVIKNAIEAMPGGGTVTIGLLGETTGRVVVRVADHGFGIPQEALNRLGDPFFTSKENGTGLGLMVSKRIIANHRGSISFDSKPGQGTTVEIRLPAARN
ncbi:PAS domain S-box protein [Cohnella sp. CFH 77786]|uniref:ATP-binding protein n=1 Tax=Cohnella sp. CFH 77786 TaxID=2662265 RepID=UPI001C609BF0|nr:ATP-binding protein [Cohnella sp. CFH 77786]MBW5446425.1 PAS domain S-box protein [Cohnella sp. CFH 77786]